MAKIFSRQSAKIVFPLLFFLVAPSIARAEFKFIGKRLIATHVLASYAPSEHYSMLMEAYDNEDYHEAIHQAEIILQNFNGSLFAREAAFFLASSYYKLEEFEIANHYLGEYLKEQATPKHFEEAIRLKFEIAKSFHGGSRRRMFHWQWTPKWAPATEEALDLYDEVIAASSQQEIGIEALFHKAQLLCQDKQYKLSLEAYQNLIRKFPKHPLSAESYLGVAETYLMQAKNEYASLELIDLAEINLRKFKLAFPQDSRVQEVDKILRETCDLYAQTLYEIGHFFQKTKKAQAAIIYYSKILLSYGTTPTAEKAKKELLRLGCDLDKFVVKNVAEEVTPTWQEYQIEETSTETTAE